MNLTKGKYYPLVHVGAWFIMIMPAFLLMFSNRQDFEHDRFIIFLFNTLFTVVNFYLFFSLLIPQLYDRNKILILLTLTLLFLIFYPLLQYNLFSYLHDHMDIKWKRLKFKDFFLAQSYTTTFLYTGLAYLARFTIKWVTEKQKQTELINQNQSSELALLRYQINPHFLFNTLNNIYSLVLKKSDNAPAAMMKLSEIMRYMLYETNSDKVPLDKEVKYLESFIELLQLRIKEKSFITFQVEGDLAGKEIAPMLLVPFVENAYKHCDKKAPSPGIIIKIQFEGKKLLFEVMNFNKEECKEDIAVNGGIGLQNIRRRLDLLYAGKHTLNIEIVDRKYKVHLELDL
ncbi:MAG: histidine kinase [Bacteroidales bacterium]|nr:histidine kinase [Bacteroidales bacterium]